MNNHLITPDCDRPTVDDGALVCMVPRSRIYACYICGNRFICKSGGKFRDTSLRKHLFEHHNIEITDTILSCRFCDYIPPPNSCSQQALNLGRHVKSDHPGHQAAPEENLEYKCTFAGCKEEYPTSNGLASHLKSHKQKPADIGKILKEIVPPISDRRKAADAKRRAKRSSSQSSNESIHSAKDSSDSDSQQQSTVNISGESLVPFVRDILDHERLNRLKDPKKWIDDGVILDLMIKRICEKSEDFLVVNPVIWDGPMPTFWRGKKVPNGIRLATIPHFSSVWKIAFIPTHAYGNHWILGVIYEHPARFVFYDTNRKGNAPIPDQRILDKWLQISTLLTGERLVIEEADPDSYPIQIDGSSCGPLKCMIAERIAAKMSTKFSLSLVADWRKEAFYLLGGVDSNPLSSPTEKKDTVIVESSNEKFPNLKKDLDKDLITSTFKSDPSGEFDAGLAKIISDEPLMQSDNNSKTHIIPQQQKEPLDDKKHPNKMKSDTVKQPQQRQNTRIKNRFNLSNWVVNEIDLWKQRGKHWNTFEDICNNFVSLGKLMLQYKFEQMEAVARKMSDKLSWDEETIPGRRSIGVQTDSRRKGNHYNKFKSKSKSSNSPKGNQQPLYVQYKTNKKATLRKILGESNESCDIPVQRLQKFFEDAAKGRPIDSAALDGLCSQIPETDEMEEDAWKPVCAENIKEFLKMAPKSSPGADRITYADLKRIDPEGKALEAIYLVCLDERRVPMNWKSSETILIYKNGDRKDPSNWRPISLQKTIYKVFSALIANSFNGMPGVISWHQKGFQQRNGCAENIQLVSEAISKAKSNRSNMAVCFLDLGNAFGSAPHELIFRMMKHFGLPQKAIDLVKDIYHGSTMTVRSKNGRTAPISLEAGVKQGDPMSPVLFDIALELLLRLSNLTFEQFGVTLPGDFKFNTGAYADDLGVITQTRAMLEQQLQQMIEWASTIHLNFKSTKCAALIIEKGQLSSDTTPITTDNGQIRLLKADEHYDYLGRPLGFERRVSPRDIIVKAAHDVSKIRDSSLMPSQKLDAIRISIIPRMTYACQTGLPYIKDLDALDRVIEVAVKRICRLPEQTASPLLCHGSIDKGGFGILKVKDEYFLQVINTVIKSLINVDPKMREFSIGRLKEITTLYCRSEATVERVNEFLSGKKDDAMHWLNRSTKTVCSDLTRFRLAIEHFTRKGIVITPSFSTNWEFSVQITVENLKVNQLLERDRLRWVYCNLRKLLGDLHIFDLSNSKISQGKMYADIAASPLSNKFVQDGRFCTVKSFRFVHRARLSLLPLGGTPMGRGIKLASHCRRCFTAPETLAHVFGTCPMNHGLIVQRHDAVLNVVLKAASKSKYVEIEKEPTLRIDGVGYKPDIICTNKTSKDVVIVDVTCPIEGGTNFLDKKVEKKRKYQPIIQHYADRGQKATIKTIIVGQLGAFDPENSSTLLWLGIPKYKINNVAREMIKNSIDNSLIIFNTHVLSSKNQIQ